jgi:PAS domain S-box-containing protein
LNAKGEKKKFAEISTVVVEVEGKKAVLGMVRDLTEEEESKRELSKTEDMLRRVTEKGKVGIVLSDAKGKFIYVNDAMCEVIGYSRKELVGKPFLKFLHPRDKKKIIKMFLKAVKRPAEAEAKELELRVIHKKGYPIYISTTPTILMKGKKIEGVSAIIIDVTERKKMEEELRDSEEKFRMLVENVSDWIWEVDGRGVYTYVSPKVEDILGYKPKEVIGKTPFDFMPKEEAKRVATEFRKIIKNKKEFQGLENWNHHKNGSKILLETSGVPILNEKGNLLGYRGVDRDVTERKKMEEELKRNVEELKKLDIEKDRFISITAHELKTPMATVLGFSKLLKEEDVIGDEEKRKKYLKIMESEINRLVSLVNEVLDLSRADLGTLKFTIESVDVPKLLDEIKNTMGQFAKENNLKLIVKIKDSEIKMKSDKEKLRQILINLVSNAIKYTNQGSVTIEAEKKDRFIEFRVKDTGIGIPGNQYEKIFERFYQIESPYTRKVKGTGLGLSICKEFVETMGGEIWLKSETGKGTTFFFKLPLNFKMKRARNMEDTRNK